MKRFNLLFSFTFILLCCAGGVFAQTNAGPPMLLNPTGTVLFCPPESVHLHAELSANNPIGIAGTQVSLSDDYFSNDINIGFPFEFYGQIYTQCVISSNNYISFNNAAYKNSYSPWSIPGPAPSSSTPAKAIMCPWQDINPGQGGIIRYQTIGTAPNRVFVVEYCSIPMFSCTGMLFSDQIKLFETTNVIETHIVEKPLCTTWNSGQAIHGLSKDAVTADIVDGRNAPTQWQAFNDGYRFIPKAGISGLSGLNNAYTQEPITFSPFLMEVTNVNIQWFAEGNTTTPVGNGSDIDVAPTTETYYVARISSGGQCAGVSFTDTVFMHFGTYYDTTIVEICAGETYNFYGKTIYKPGIYDTVFLHDNTCDSFMVVDLRRLPLPVMTVKGSTNVQICEGSSTVLSLLSPQAGVTYQWYKDNVPVSGETSSLITVTQPGSYKVEGTTAKGCKATSDVFILQVNPNPVANIEPLSNEVICAYDTMSITAVAGAGYEYRWTPEKPFRIVTGADGQKVKGIFIDPTLITLTVYNQFGCYDTATAWVQTKPCCEVFIPNAFSPNGDGLNEYFNPVLQLGQTLLTMQVFDRYGKLIYNNTNIKKGWNGKYDDGGDATSDVYMYYIKYTCADGKLYEKKESVSLIR